MESVCAKWLACWAPHEGNRDDYQYYDGEGFLPLRTDYSETSRPSPPVRQGGLAPCPLWRWEGSSFPGGLPGAPLGAMSREHDLWRSPQL